MIATAFACFVVWAYVGLGSSEALAASPAGARWERSPAWVEELAVDTSADADPDAVRDGTYALLRDVRIRLERHSVERYYRSVTKAVNQAGVEGLGELQIEYAPQFEHVLLHRALVIRDGKVVNQSERAALRLIDAEDEQAQGIYNGRVSALLVLSDVRAGDVIDVSWSVLGNNEALGDRFATHLLLGGESGVRRVHVEVSSAPSRAPLHWSIRGTAPPPTESTTNGKRVLIWELADVPARPREDRVPATFVRPAQLALSEFASWAEVASWASELYPAVDAASLRAKARELRAAAPELDEAVLAAIRFVQDDVRYLSLSLGPHSLKPHAPATVLAQRFGDCKDKSYLLVELLRALGVKAYPALADTDLRIHLRESLPSPFAFDHVITAIDVGGRRYFVDPTWAHQGGSLSRLAAPDLGAVLVVASETSELATLPQPPTPNEPPRSVVQEVLVRDDGSASLNVTTTLAGADADEMRARLALRSASDLSRDYLNYYAQQFPEVSVAAPLQVKDERRDDVITIREGYSIPKFWRDGERRLVPDHIGDYVEPPDVTQREAPLALYHPVWIRERMEVSLPFVPGQRFVKESYGDEAATVQRVIDAHDHQIVATHEYRSLSDVVPREALSRHLEFLAQGRDTVGLELNERPAPRGAYHSRSALSPSKLVFAPLGIGLLAAIGFLVTVARRGNRRRRSEPTESETWTCVPAVSLEAARADFTLERCECGSELSHADVQFTKVRLDGRTLHAARVDCRHCEHRRRGYFDLPDEEADESASR